MVTVDEYMVNKLKKKYGDEQVLVVPFQIARDIPNGFSYTINKTFSWNVQTKGKFVYRYDAEYNKALVQIIPYVIVHNGDKVFTAERTDTAEMRLQRQYLIGFGGHINPCDIGVDTVYNAAIRELKEELFVDDLKTLRQIGTVRDLTSPTSEHLGIVFTLQADKVEVREKENLIGSWMDLKQLANSYNKFESWAQFIIDHLFVNSKIPLFS